MSNQENNDKDWIDYVVDVAEAFGFNGIRLRWKLQRFKESRKKTERRSEQKRIHIKYDHKSCPQCGQVNDRNEKDCVNCGTKLYAKHWHLLSRLGLSVPEFISVSALLGLVIAGIYIRTMIAEGVGLSTIVTMKVETLIRFGGHFVPAVHQGDWWRRATSLFLHAGLWHIAFNLFALSQIGPPMEAVFGRLRVLFLFMLTGIVANLLREALGAGGVAIGASGAIMGLCGVAGGWGHRDGTTLGKELRNQMVKWGIYTMVFGFFIGADNIGHAGGFISGALIGVFVPSRWLQKTGPVPLGILTGLLGFGLAVMAVVFILGTPGR